MRMKHLALVALAVLGSALFAMPAQARVRFGIETGLNWARLTDAPVHVNFGTHPDWTAGATADIPLVGGLALATGLRYVEYGETYVFTVTSVSGDLTSLDATTYKHREVWRYLAIPARVKYGPPSWGGLYVSLGPEAGYLLEATAEAAVESSVHIEIAMARTSAARPAGQIFEDVGTFDDTHKTRFYERLNLAAVGGVGCAFPMLRHQATFEVRYSQGLLDIQKSAAFNRHVTGLEGLLGLRW